MKIKMRGAGGDMDMDGDRGAGEGEDGDRRKVKMKLGLKESIMELVMGTSISRKEGLNHNLEIYDRFCFLREHSTTNT